MHYLMPKQKYVAGAMAMTCARMDVRRTREMVILGTQYAGEMKKGIFSVMHYLMPKRGILSLHSGCNVGASDDVSLFFGLSGVLSWISIASLCAQWPCSSPLWQQLGAPHCTLESRQLAGGDYQAVGSLFSCCSQTCCMLRFTFVACCDAQAPGRPPCQLTLRGH